MAEINAAAKTGLNPCFSGRWSRSLISNSYKIMKVEVLILVLVEDGLGVRVLQSPRTSKLFLS